MEFPRGNASHFTVNILKAALLLFLVISALWCVAASANGSNEEDEGGDTMPWTSQRQPSRFLLQNVNSNNRSNPRGRNFCGGGRSPNFSCRIILPWPAFRNPQCCTTSNNNRVCIDVGGNNNRRCGSCTRSCRFGQNCCAGVCVNQQTDSNNCGRCGKRCKRGVTCRHGICGYNG